MKTQQENLKVSFYLKKNVSRKGLCPVMGRITVGHGDMVQFSCKLEADPSLWDTRAGRMNGKSNNARMVNREIDKINVAVHARYREIISIRGFATANEVKNACQGIASSQETLLQVFSEHNRDYEKRIGVNRTKRTFWHYRIGYTSLENFIKHKYHVCDLSFRQLDYSFIENYDYWLRIDCRMMPATILQRVICLQKMVKIAIRKKIISHNPFTGYVPERPKTEHKFLPMAEVEKLIKTPLKDSALDFTRDMFVFSCYTGLSYIDLYKLTFHEIEKGGDGMLWLNISRQKTNSSCKIPLMEIPLQLIEKYRGIRSGERVFQMKACCQMNLQLKTIAKLCNIDRQLTFHMARHTFATETCLSQGIPIETVSKMLGHRNMTTTQRYAKVTHNRVNDEMTVLSEKIAGKYELAS